MEKFDNKREKIESSRGIGEILHEMLKKGRERLIKARDSKERIQRGREIVQGIETDTD